MSPVANTKDECPNIGAEDDDNAVDDNQAGEESQEEKPEPDEDVDLFVDCNRMGLLSKHVHCPGEMLLKLMCSSYVGGGGGGVIFNLKK